MYALLSEAAEVSVQTGTINAAGWALTLGGIIVTVLWLRSLTR